MALTVGELVGYLRLDSSQWTRALVKARKQLGDTESGLRRFGRRSEVLATAAVRMGAFSAASSLAGSAVSGLVAGVAAASGSLLLLPALLTAGGVAFGAATLGAQGFGDALASMDDPAKFAEALEELAPAARETAIAARDLAPTWEELQQATQQELFAGTADVVRELGAKYLPILRAGLTSTAAELNEAARSAGAFALEADTIRDVEAILDNSSAAAGNLTATTRPLLQIFRDVAAAGAEFLPGLTSGLGAAAERAAAFVAEARESGQLAGWIQGGIDAVSTLSSIVGNLASVVGSIFSAMSADGGGALATLDDLTGRLAEFLASGEGSTTLGQIFAGLSAAAAGLVPALTSVVSALLTALGPVVAELGPAVGQLAAQVGATLVTAIQAAAPLLLAMATFLQQNMSWIGPLTIAVVGLAAALGPAISIVMGLVNAFKAVTLILQVLRVAMLTNPFTAIITAVVLLAVLIVSNWDTIKAYLLAAWEWIKTTAASVWNGIVSFFTETWNSITS
ncbi:Phage-related minor tail protein, partial [Saccharopolyspora antimicrobica]